MPLVQSSRDKRRTSLPVVLFWLFVIVVTLTVLFMDAAGFFRSTRNTRAKATQATLSTVAAMLRTYNLETGSYPPTLDALVPKYIEKLPIDAWKHPLVYTLNPSGPPFTLGSLGADGQTGGSGDEADIWAQVP